MFLSFSAGFVPHSDPPLDWALLSLPSLFGFKNFYNRILKSLTEHSLSKQVSSSFSNGLILVEPLLIASLMMLYALKK